MKVLVAGAGAVGCWLGGSLAAAGAEVTLLARVGQRDGLERDGLTLHCGRRTTHVRPRVVTALATVAGPDPFELALVAVKGYATAAVARELAEGCSAGHIVSVQNGIGNEAVLADALPGRAVIAGSLTTAVSLRPPGVVESSVKGGVGLAAGCRAPLGADAAGAPLAHLAEAFRAAGIAVRCYPDGAAMKWSKLLLNLLGSATPAILGWSPAQVFADRRVFGIERAAWLEALAVMGALALRPVVLPGYPVPAYAAVARCLPEGWLYRLARGTLASARADRLPSVAADLCAGRAQTEVDVLNGAVVRAGQALGVATPVNRVLTEIVNDLASGRLDRRTMADRPELLCQHVQSARRDG